MGIFQKRQFKLHSGGVGDFKIECDNLDSEDIETLAYLISKKLKFSCVVGVPSGGLRLAAALQKYCNPEHPMLIVDDVLTTGKSMQEYKNQFPNAIGAVIFARGVVPDWIYSVFNMNLCYENC